MNKAEAEVFFSWPPWQSRVSRQSHTGQASKTAFMKVCQPQSFDLGACKSLVHTQTYP